MATEGPKQVVCILDKDGVLELKHKKEDNHDPDYSGIVVSGDKIMVADANACNVQLYRCQDGHLLATSFTLVSQPCGICAINDQEICVLLKNSIIEIMLVQCTRDTGTITWARTLCVKPAIDEFHGVVKLMDNIIVCGEEQGTICWCIVSLIKGHVDPFHQICKGYQICKGSSNSHLTTKDNMIYISHYAGSDSPDTGVYAYDIQNLIKHTFIYKHNDLKNPSGITVDTRGFIFVCNNHPVLPPCIHHLTYRCQLVTIYSVGIPWNLKDIFWDQQNGHLYVTSRMSNMITRYKPVYSDQQGEDGGGGKSSLLQRLKRTFGFYRFLKKIPNKHSQDDKVHEVLVSEERKQPLNKETLTEIEQGVTNLHVKGVSFLESSSYRHAIYMEKSQLLVGNVDIGQSSVEIEMPPSVQVPKDFENGKQGPVIPEEILHMDAKSIQLYKEALRDGKEKVYNIRVMVVGQYGVGKTALTKRLLGRQVDILERKSTEGIDVYKHSCKISLDTGEWIVQHEDSDQLSRLQRLVKLLTGPNERPEVTGEQKGHTEVVYQRETTPNSLHSLAHDIDSDDDDISTIGVVIFTDSGNSSESDSEQKVHTYINQPDKSLWVKVEQRSPALEASSVSIQESGKQVASKGDATMEFLQLAIEKADKLEKSIVEYATLSVWDFAGQYVFYTTHQAFLTCRAIYLLVTDLSKQITDVVEDDECYFDTEGVKLCQVQDLVEVWLNSIHSCAPSSTASTPITSPAFSLVSPTADTVLTSHGPSTTVTSPDVSIPVTPPVILVGTHVDKIQEDKCQEVINKYFKQICYILKDKPTLQHLLGFYAIDNTQCDPQLETLKKRILQLASKQPYWGEEVPANWLPLEEALMKLKAAGIKVIQLRVVEELNQAATVPVKTAEQLDLFLRFQHETGNILYFSVKGLKEWIVLDPIWIIGALKSLITAETFILDNNPAILASWSEFKEMGKLTPELIGAVMKLDGCIYHGDTDHHRQKNVTMTYLSYSSDFARYVEYASVEQIQYHFIDAIWTNEIHPEFHQHKAIILQLMEKLNIVARPRFYSPDAEEVKVEGYFLAPCMLRHATPKELLSLGPNSQHGSTSVLSFVFTERFLPSPVFHRLLAACVAQWPIAKQKFKNLIFCGCCVFDVDLHHRLTVFFREHVIFARITKMGTTEKTPSSKLCIGVQEFITMTLSNIIGYLGQSLRFEHSMQCPLSDRYSVDCLIPVAKLQGNVDVPCHFHDNSHLIMSHDVLKFWFQEKEQSDDGSPAVSMQSPPTSDTDRFMSIAYMLTDIGSKVLRKRLHHIITPTFTLDQYLAKNRNTINRLLKQKVLNPSQMDIMFPPNGDDTNLDTYDITLLSVLYNNIVPSLGYQEKNMIKSLRDNRNKFYGHAKSCKMNARDFQTCWSNISSTLITLSQQCGDPHFENEILKEIQLTRVPDASYLSILQTWFSRLERVEQRLESNETSPTSET